MIRSDSTILARTPLRAVGFVALALLLGLLGGCADQNGGVKTDQDNDPSEADEDEADDSDDSDEGSPAQRDGGTSDKDAGKKDASTKPSGTPKDASTEPGADASRPATRDAGPSSTPDAAAPVVTPPADGTICARWKADRANISEGTWTGNAESCMAGDMTADARANALRLFNLYRFMVGLPPVTNSIEGNRLAQDCALLMRANGTITHTPPSTWKCYTAEAAKTANSSSLSSGPAVGSVDGYMVDPGNPTTIGHRRWILSNWLTEVGFGSADRFSCQYQPARPRGGAGAKAWAAWPPGGEVPFQAFGARFLGTLDQTGWTVQSDSINLSSAQVTVTSAGAEKPVTVTQLGPGYGSMYALRFNPMGWTTKAGETYSVKLSGTSMPIEYEVKVVDCP